MFFFFLGEFVCSNQPAPLMKHISEKITEKMLIRLNNIEHTLQIISDSDENINNLNFISNDNIKIDPKVGQIIRMNCLNENVGS